MPVLLRLVCPCPSLLSNVLSNTLKPCAGGEPPHAGAPIHLGRRPCHCRGRAHSCQGGALTHACVAGTTKARSSLLLHRLSQPACVSSATSLILAIPYNVFVMESSELSFSVRSPHWQLHTIHADGAGIDLQHVWVLWYMMITVTHLEVEKLETSYSKDMMPLDHVSACVLFCSFSHLFFPGQLQVWRFLQRGNGAAAHHSGSRRRACSEIRLFSNFFYLTLAGGTAGNWLQRGHDAAAHHGGAHHRRVLGAVGPLPRLPAGKNHRIQTVSCCGHSVEVQCQRNSSSSSTPSRSACRCGAIPTTPCLQNSNHQEWNTEC